MIIKKFFYEVVQMEYKFLVPKKDGNHTTFVLNDSHVYYPMLRSNVPESICIEAIEQVKKRSGKKCAIIFGNCQTIRLQYIFLNHMQFRREYFLLTVPAVCSYDENLANTLYGGCLSVNMLKRIINLTRCLQRKIFPRN